VRDYALVLLQLYGNIERKKLADLSKLSVEQMKELLSQICVKYSVGYPKDHVYLWKLKLEPDENFMRHFPEITQKYKFSKEHEEAVRESVRNSIFTEESISQFHSFSCPHLCLYFF
jgi:hypothetical protein